MKLQLKGYLGDGRECEVCVEVPSKQTYSEISDEEFEQLINVLAHRSIIALQQVLNDKTQKLITFGY